MFFKKKNKINSKFQKNEFVGFHLNGDLKHGSINNIKELNGEIYYDIKVGGEATWLAKDIKEDKIIKIKE